MPPTQKALEFLAFPVCFTKVSHTLLQERSRHAVKFQDIALALSGFTAASI